MSASQRRVYLFDLMILVAFTALGTAWCVAEKRSRPQVPPTTAYPVNRNRPPNPPPAAVSKAPRTPPPTRMDAYCAYSSFLLLAWGFAFLVLRARKPRPPLRLLIRSPGAAACVAVLVLSLVTSMGATAHWVLNRWRPLVGSEIGLTSKLSASAMRLHAYAGHAIIAMWLILWLSRAIVFERNWLELFGLLIGIAWILLFFEPVVTHVLWKLSGA